MSQQIPISTSTLPSSFIHWATHWWEQQSSHALTSLADEQFPLRVILANVELYSIEEVAQVISHLSPEKRQLLWDLDCWVKDELDPNRLEWWIQVMNLVTDDGVRVQFIQSEVFQLYLKGYFTISSFDDEEPEYPEHEHFFLTDDHLLLFETPPDYPHAKEIQNLLRTFYAQLGVEVAYAHLFKTVVDFHTSMLEEEYQLKRSRLEDIGIPDYLTALETLHPFNHQSSLDQWINSKQAKPFHGNFIDHHIWHPQVLKILPQLLGPLSHSWDLVTKTKETSSSSFQSMQDRLHVLSYNLSYLIECYIQKECQGNLNYHRKGSVVLQRLLKQMISYTCLGLEYLAIADWWQHFTFVDLYRIGASLIKIAQDRWRKVIDQYAELNSFWGVRIQLFLQNALAPHPKTTSVLIAPMPPSVEVNTWPRFKQWQEGLHFIESMIPTAYNFSQQLHQLAKEQKIHDWFYRNVKITELDWEYVLITHYAHYVVNQRRFDQTPQLGLQTNQALVFREHLIQHFAQNLSFQLKDLEQFQDHWGLKALGGGFALYLQALLYDHFMDENGLCWPADPALWNTVTGIILLADA